MADRYWRGTTSTDWSNTNNWSNTSGGSTGFSAPSSADNVFFDANGNNPCTLTSVSNSCLSFVMSNGYTSTFNHNTRTLNVTGTILTLSSAMTYTATTGVFNFSQGATITLNGNTVNNIDIGLFGGTTTITFVGTNNIVNFTRSGNAASTIFSGGTVNISGNLVVGGQNSGTTLFRYVGGTGTWSGTGVLPTLEIVSGTLTLSGTVGCPSILTYLGGTINTSGSTLSIQGNTTLNTSGINWLNVSFTSFVPATATLTLLSNFNVTGNVNCNSTNGILNIVNSGGSWTSIGGVLSNSVVFTLNLANPITCNGLTSSVQQFTINNHSVTNTGNLTVGSGLVGTSKVILSGTGTWSGASLINMDMDINTAGTITLSGASVIFGQQGSGVNPRFNYITGTIVQGSTIFRMEEGRYDMAGVTWSNLLTGTNGTIVTLLANINCVNFTPTSGCTLNGAFNFNVNGNLTPSGNPIQGTATIRMVGTGTLSGTGNIFTNLVFNTAGTITLSGTINYRNSTFTHTSGTVNAETSTLTLGQATNFVINSTGFALNNLNPSTFNVTFSGTNGCTINNFSAGVITAGVTHTFQSLNTYNIATLQVAATISSPATIRSSTPTSQAILTLTNASNNYMLNVTDINSGLGAAGFTSGGILTNATNWTTAAAALYYIGNTNYSGTNLWSGASGGSPITAITAPASSDPVIFDTNSGNCIMNVAGVAGSVNFTNYTNTITFSNSLSVSGNITLGSGMTFAGVARLIYADATNSTLTSNGKEVGVEFEFACTANHTITFADNWTFGENLILQSNQSATVMIYNGNNLLCKKSLLTNNSGGRDLYGTTKIQMIGSGDIGTVIANLNVGLDLEINTVGSYTIRNLTWGYLGGRTLKYTTGTVTHAIGTTLFLSINLNATNTLDLNGIDFQTITITGGSTNVYNLSSNLKCATLSNSGTPFTVNGNTIYVTSYSCTANAQTGTSLIYFNGWNGDGTFASGNFQLSATIDTPNTLTITDVTAQGGASITHIQGNIVHTGTLTLATYTLSFLPNIILNIIFLNTANATTTIQSDITCRVFSLGNVNVTLAGVGYTLYILNEYRGITSNSTYTNTAKISFIGSGIIAMIFGAGTTVGEFEINTSGVVTLVGQLAFSGTFRHVKGTVISKGSQVILRTGATVLGASRMNLDNVFIVGGSTITMDEFFSGTPQVPTKVVSSNNVNYTINFTDGFEKLAKNVRVSRCTIGKRGQLLLLSKGGFGVNNLGIRYYNQSPNGVATDTQKFVNNNLAGMPALRAVNMLVGDPVFT